MTAPTEGGPIVGALDAPLDSALDGVPADVVERARELAASGRRRLLGIAGAPGSGKSTLAAAVVRAVGERAVCVPMDGFHLAQAELERLGRADRKGAPDTFDAAGLVALLSRLRWRGTEHVYAPAFDRRLEEPIAGSIAVGPDVTLVVVEGNYLLHSEGWWGQVGPLLDECWYVETDEELRVERLVARHVAHGRSPEAARAWTLGPDQSNADLVATTRRRADEVVRLG
jgi:pantothenate kinase